MRHESYTCHHLTYLLLFRGLPKQRGLLCPLHEAEVLPCGVSCSCVHGGGCLKQFHCVPQRKVWSKFFQYWVLSLHMLLEILSDTKIEHRNICHNVWAEGLLSTSRFEGKSWPEQKPDSINNEQQEIGAHLSSNLFSKHLGCLWLDHAAYKEVWRITSKAKEPQRLKFLEKYII